MFGLKRLSRIGDEKDEKQCCQGWLSTKPEKFEAVMSTEVTKNDPKKWWMKANQFFGLKEKDNGGGEGKFQLPVVEAVLRREEDLNWYFFWPEMKQFLLVVILDFCFRTVHESFIKRKSEN